MGTTTDAKPRQENLFVTAIFDKETEERLRGYQETLASSAGLSLQEPRHRPHVTFASYPAAWLSEVVEFLRVLSNSQSASPVTLRSLGVFVAAGTLFAQPVPTAELIKLHSRVIAGISTPTLFPHHLAPDNWHPHATIGTGLKPNEIIEAVRVVRDSFVPIDGKLIGFGILDQSSAKINAGSIEDSHQFWFGLRA